MLAVLSGCGGSVITSSTDASADATSDGAADQGAPDAGRVRCGSMTCSQGEYCEILAESGGLPCPDASVPTCGLSGPSYACKKLPASCHGEANCSCAAACPDCSTGPRNTITCTLIVKCASPDTPIATPTGETPIASLSVGDLVLSVDHGVVAAVPIRAVRRQPVSGHRVVEVALRDGATLHVSAMHPTADGRLFGARAPGDWLGGKEVVTARDVPYRYDATYDILPDSDTATYFAEGALIGSTLAAQPPRHAPRAETCSPPPVVGQR